MKFETGDIVIRQRNTPSDGIYEFVNYANDTEDMAYITNNLADSELKVYTKYLTLACRWKDRADAKN